MSDRARPSAKRVLTAIDVFSGCGGLTVGLKRAGFEVKGAIEILGKAQETYRLNHPEVEIFGDIRKLTGKGLLRSLGMRRGQLDLLAGCPPCQGFSRLRTLNKRKSRVDPRNDLVLDFLRLVRALKPRSVMLENVPSLRTDGRLLKLLKYLSRSGYKSVTEVLDVSEYGVPQRRKRLILLASRVHLPQIGHKVRRSITVRQALKGLSRPSKSSDALHSMPERRSAAVAEIVKLVPKNGGSRSDLPAKYKLPCHRRCKGFLDVYGRMSWDELAPTITSGCANPSKGRFLHPSQNRTITLREAALLQGFPRKYKFDVSHGKEAISLMIGNALPPPFVAVHAKSIRRGIERVAPRREGG